MSKKIIHSIKGPKAVGPYSQGVISNNLLFLSGQIPIDPATGQLVGPDIQTQTEQVLKNISVLLEERFLNLKNVIKTTVFLIDLNDFSLMNEIYGSFFKDEYPARSTIQVSKLPRDARIEIEAIAYL